VVRQSLSRLAACGGEFVQAGGGVFGGLLRLLQARLGGAALRRQLHRIGRQRGGAPRRALLSGEGRGACALCLVELRPCGRGRPRRRRITSRLRDGGGEQQGGE
jgi:hypothetical protein